MLTYTLKVVELKKETKDTVTICFKQPALKKVSYLPGQYLTLIFRINGRRYIRPYSFSSAPGVDPCLEVTVKRIPGGIVSNHINDKVTEGDMVEVLKPMGDFVFDPAGTPPSKHIMLWGAGSGITPLISIAKYILHHNTGNRVTLAYGNRDFESVIFLNKIGEMLKEYPDMFKAVHFHTRLTVDAANPYLIQGRITEQKVLALLEQTDNSTGTIHYICGPTGLKESVRQALAHVGVAPDDIHYEDFEIVRDPKDFEEVTTQTISLIKDNKKHAVEVPKGKSILESGLDALLELSYSCQTGNCTVCKGTLRQGAIKMIGVNKRPADLQDNEYLLCCSYPLGENVEVEV
ncbi:ferredoxin--NADP reductase [Hufsiella ginkgonis]|uniref:2Fe-2S iron-sulfur cluster binding domain-containing protein n=1 Tax=Hufsiella ginkgonis TaxID=2695274 RepID=A0A7K1Y2J4_9SPHI|nr:ferredoxin--NADP reductase [Hufsiella ginkgonis]MXV17432.1 2Fe-2S iron-sulfur cluster binding domain-containing protein [Hufsiella ginkgonis]